MSGSNTLGKPQASAIIRYKEEGYLALSFINDSGAELKVGQEVILKTNGKLDKRDAGTEYAIGIVEVGAADGKKVTVLCTNIAAVIWGEASGDLSNEGQFVKPSGAVDATTGYPIYAAVASGDFAQAIVLEGNTTGNNIKVGILRTAHIVPA